MSYGLPPKDFKDLADGGKINVVGVPIPNGVWGCYLNTQVGPFKDVRLRQAVAWVMPYDKIMQAALFGRGVSMAGGTTPKVAWPQPFPYTTDVAKAKALVDLAPDVTFILDHCGVPDIKGHGYDAWKTGIIEIAKRENVRVKISGIPAYGDLDNWTLDDLQPYFGHVISAFGFDRAIWGSDWPVCTLGGGLSTWVATTQALLHGCTTEEKDRLFSGNARGIWQLG